MCGFFQVIQKGAPVDQARFREALLSMRHRGPDQDGELYLRHEAVAPADGEPVHMAFGHRRLSILDLSDRSRQPYVLGGDVLLYNGELYNFRELAEDLRAQGCPTDAAGDTEVLLKSLVAGGQSAVGRFNGMWAFSLYRPDSGTVLLSRDRYGKKPLFYYQDERLICISSTINAIQIYRNEPLRFATPRLINYLTFGDLWPAATSETHFEGIRQLLPGHNAVLDLASWSLASQPFFDFYGGSDAAADVDDEHALAELLRDSVRKRLVSDRPVGLLLSGGIDSSLILSTLHAMGLHEQCRVYMGETGKSEDYRYASKCVEQLGIKAETVVLDYEADSFDRFLAVCRHMEKPVSLNGSTMAMPAMYEAIAAQGVPVVLDGTGGDEVFGGYWQRQFPYAVREAVAAGDWHWVRRQLHCKTAGNEVKSHVLSAFVPAAVLGGARILGKRLKAYAHPFFKLGAAELRATAATDPLADLSMSFDRAMCADIAPGGRLGEWIWHNDRNSMMSSVEGRSPLLDYRLHRYALGGYRRKFRDCWNKYELRKVFDVLTPLETQWRKQKQGFRWDGKRFMYANQGPILELIRENRALADLVDVRRVTDYASKRRQFLRSTLCKQLLAVSGVEQELLLKR